MMIGRGSPKFFLQANKGPKKVSPKSGMGNGTANIKGPPREQPRASWNSMLEKALVDVMLENNNCSCRGQNGWNTEGWNMIVKGLHENFPNISLTKSQIQDKEKELNKDYKTLKDARNQIGVSWDHKLCMIIAYPPVWDNIIKSRRRAQKFRRRPFQLFDALGELYDGQTAECLLNFTSLEPSQHVVINQVGDSLDSVGTFPDIEHRDDPDDIIEVESETRNNMAAGDKREKIVRNANTAPKEKEAKKPKRSEGVAEMMGRYLELKTKQAEEDMKKLKQDEEEISNGTSNTNDYSIKSCVSLINTMQELSNAEKVKAFGVFKDPANREIFISAEPVTRLLWLQSMILYVGNEKLSMHVQSKFYYFDMSKCTI